MTGYMIPNKEHPMNNEPVALAGTLQGALTAFIALALVFGWTALFSFIGQFSVTLLGWLQDVVVWASDSGVAEFPTLSVLGYGLVAAAASAAIGLVNFVVRYAQARNVLPGSGPSYGDA